MKQVMHFRSTEERLKFLKGKFEEIVPEEIIPKEVEEAPKPKKKKGKKKKDDAVSAE